MDFEEILQKHWEKYPLMQTDDMVKLCYQNEFGCGHFINSPADSLKSIENEISMMKSAGISEKKVENIGNGYSRMYLGICDEIPTEILNKMFVFTAANSRGSDEGFLAKKEIVKNFAYSVLDCSETDSFFKDYDKTGEISPCSHSRKYKNAYHPFYRVVFSGFGEYSEVFAAITELVKKKKNPVISIDGPSCSGKTFLAHLLSSVFTCNLIHTDDFFLPADRRTNERMEIPGGNFDYERFKEQVAEPLKKGISGEYGVFDCKKQEIVCKKSFNCGKMTIVEGSYCNHGAFGKWCDANFYLDTPAEICMCRLKEREDSEKLEKFEKIWLPAEKLYFEGMDVKNRCRIVKMKETEL